MSGIGLTGKTSSNELDVTEQQILNDRNSLFGEMPAEIVSFDPVSQSATVQPLYKPRHNGAHIVLAKLEMVPIHFPHGKKGGLTFPLSAGDRVMLRPQMRSNEAFHTTGEFVANDQRSFSLSDMEGFVDGGRSMTDPIKNFDANNAQWRYDDEGNFGWFGSDDGKTKCVLGAGELIDTIAKLAEACADNLTTVVGGSSSGNHEHSSKALFEEIAKTLRDMELK